MKFWGLVFEYNTLKEIWLLIIALCKHKQNKEQTTVEFLMVTFIRMCNRLLGEAWQQKIAYRVRDFEYINEFTNYLVELDSYDIFKNYKNQFVQFGEVYVNCYYDFLKHEIENSK